MRNIDKKKKTTNTDCVLAVWLDVCSSSAFKSVF